MDGLKEAILNLCDDIPVAPRIRPARNTDSDLMTFLPIPDLHLGMYIDPAEVSHGLAWNLEIAEKYYYKTMSYLIENSPRSKQCVIYDAGDILHVDNNNNRTAKSGHPLNTSDRYGKCMTSLFGLMINTIYMALDKFEEVYFYSVPGNHNEQISLVLKCVLANHFKDNPNVHIDIDTYKTTVYHKFGKTIIGMAHGNMLRPEKANEVMVADNLSDISNYTNFAFYFGHFHDEKTFRQGITEINILKPLIPTEAWSDSMGYRGEVGYGRADIFHKQFGKISTINYRSGLEMIK